MMHEAHVVQRILRYECTPAQPPSNTPTPATGELHQRLRFPSSPSRWGMSFKTYTLLKFRGTTQPMMTSHFRRAKDEWPILYSYI